MYEVYQDELVTEYNDGTEEIRFRDVEYVIMGEDPQDWGYACPMGLHAYSGGFDARGICGKCEVNMDTEEGEALPYPSEFKPKRIKCGKCGERHRFADMVRVCYGLL